MYEKGARIRSPLVGFQKTGQQDHLPCGHGDEFFQSRASRLDFQARAPEAGGISEYALISVEASTGLPLEEAGETGVVLVINSSYSRTLMVFVAPLSHWGPLK